MGVAAAAGLEGGLLVSADHVIALAQRSAVPGPGVQVKHPGGLRRELGGADGDPRPVLPGLEGIVGQPPADRGRRDRDLAAGGQFAGQVRAASPRQRHAGLGGQCACQRDDLGPVCGSFRPGSSCAHRVTAGSMSTRLPSAQSARSAVAANLPVTFRSHGRDLGGGRRVASG